MRIMKPEDKYIHLASYSLNVTCDQHHRPLDLEEFSAIATKSTSFQGLKFVCEPTKPVVDA